MNRDPRILKLLLAAITCAVLVPAAAMALPGLSGGHPTGALATAELGLAPSPGIGLGGSTAIACDGVATCTTGAVTNVTAGDTLIILVTEFTTSAGSPSLVEEVTSGGDTDLSLLGATPCISGSGHGVTALYGLANVTAQTSVTFTVNYAADEYYTIHALDVEGAAVSPFETAGTGVCSGAAGTTATASVTTTVADDLVILGAEVRASTTFAASGGDTLVTQAVTTGADLDSGAMLEELDPSTGSISLSTTFTSASWSGLAIALKASPLVSGIVSPPAATLDAGQTLTLTTTSATGGTAPITYQWYTASSATTCDAGTLIGGAINESYTTPALSAGSDYYCVWASDSSTPTPQVVTSNVANITVNPALSVAISPSAPSVDDRQTVQLTATPSGGTGMDTYAWYSGASCSGTVLATTPVYTTAALGANTSYCVSATDSSTVPATANATVPVTVSASPLTVRINPSAPSIGTGQTVQLTATPSGGTGADTYLWYEGSACTGTVLATTQVYTTPALSANTTYCVAVTDSSSIPVSAEANATVTVHPASGGSKTSPPPYEYLGIGALVALLLAVLLLGLVRRGPRVTFTQTGLPEKAVWSLSLKGEAKSSTGRAIRFKSSKGQYDYTVREVVGYTATPPSGTVTVDKTSVEVSIVFTNRSA